jgi:hypothetical protein
MRRFSHKEQMPAQMLTRSDSDRILEEEVLRSEIRSHLEADRAARGGKGHVWRFLNSGIVLWALSSVVLAGVSKCYTDREADRKALAERQETVRRLDLEIANRIAQASITLRTDSGLVERGDVFSRRSLYAVPTAFLNNSYAENSSNQQDYSTFPEYRSRTFRSLVSELAYYVPASEGPKLQSALGAYEMLADSAMLADTTGNNPKSANLAAIRTARAVLEGRVLQLRWADAWALAQGYNREASPP